MGLKENIQALMPRVITMLGTLASTATYHSVGTFVYDPATGANVETGGSDTSVQCAVVDYTQEEIQKNTKYEIFMTDKKVLIPSLSLPGVVPKVTDYLTVDSVVYKVISKTVDPAEAMWEIQARV